MYREEIARRIGTLADRTENFMQWQNAAIPPQIKLDAMWHGLKELEVELKLLYIELAGNDPWNMPEEN
jgi:hypothetical protein